MDVPILAGMISTVVFAVSNLPMLRKALRTRDVSSYSLSSIAMINAANVVYSLYVFSLPLGPIWALHTFYVVSCAIMLVLCVQTRSAAASRKRAADASGVASAGDVEAALADRVDVGGLDVRDHGAARPVREPLAHRRDLRLVALDLGHDGAVGAIADPARDAQPASLESRGVAEPHALHGSVHDHSPADHPTSVR